jgi:two-component system chemotaxis response regulator CheY
MRSLAIDDDFVALSKMVAMLKPFGQCDAGMTSHEALVLFSTALKEARPYDLITIDINLPDMNGITLLGRLQEEESEHNAPCARKLMVTAEGTRSNVLMAANGKCDGFLAKPVRRAVLNEKLVALGLLVEDT